MNIYLLRHGQTEENKSGYYYGKLDVSLNGKGRVQSEKSAQYLKNIGFERVYISERIRTKETAEIVLPNFKEFTTDKRINEMDFGEFEGKNYEQIKKLYPKQCDAWNSNWKDFRPPMGESYIDFYNRVSDFIQEILRQKHENVLIVTHGGVIRTIYCYILGGNLDNFWKFSSKNADISLIKYQYGNIFIDSITHME